MLSEETQSSESLQAEIDNLLKDTGTQEKQTTQSNDKKSKEEQTSPDDEIMESLEDIEAEEGIVENEF